jgi:serine/threonine-protein kinase
MTCPRCGTQLEAGARFCGACGTRLDAAPAPAPARPGGKNPDLAKTIVNNASSPAFPPVSTPVPPRPAAGGGVGVRAPAPAAAPAAPRAIPRPAPVAPAAPADPFLGKTLNNRYVVESKLGEGGFGSVYKGRQVVVGREVALKLLRPDMARDPNIVARFRREGAVACNLRDAHTITTYDFDQTPDGVLYIAMELLKGKSLHDVFHDEAPLPWDRVLRILEQMCTSLGEAHTQGIVHRDLKPENVYLENRQEHPDFVKILDFGIAKIVSGDIGGGDRSPQLTATGQTLGTLEYMSPEQLMGKQLDGRSDIYALGVVAYEMMTGQLPFPDAKGPADLIAAQLKKTPPPPSQVRPEMRIPPGVDQVIFKMIEKSRDKRFSDVAVMRQACLEVLATGGQPSALAAPVVAPAAHGSAPAPSAAPSAAAAKTPVPRAQTPLPVPPQMGAAALMAAPNPPPQMVPMHSSAPRVNPMQPQMQPMAMAQAVRAPSTREALAASKGASRLWLWILLGAAIAGGTGAAVYFLAR